MRISTLVSIALLLAATQGAHAQPASEIPLVVQEVLSTKSWVADAETCPSTLVQPREATDATQATDCGPGKLKSCLKRCQQGVAGACYWLGHTVRGEGDRQQAAEVLYQRSCKLGVASGCTNRAAGMSSRGTGGEAVQACAAKTFEKTCALNDPWGCTMYAFHLSRGVGIPANRELALEALKKSCKYGPEDEACGYGQGLREQILKAAPPAK